ncbi:hypothetical protein U0070_014994 [Myodes glareolus]|uniref:Uncharacterized protein n=1 Tax=Myodes glareolus TaxID=447135 RepID=A0AAW0I5M2_MYOGA
MPRLHPTVCLWVFVIHDTPQDLESGQQLHHSNPAVRQAQLGISANGSKCGSLKSYPDIQTANAHKRHSNWELERCLLVRLAEGSETGGPRRPQQKSRRNKSQHLYPSPDAILQWSPEGGGWEDMLCPELNYCRLNLEHCTCFASVQNFFFQQIGPRQTPELFNIGAQRMSAKATAMWTEMISNHNKHSQRGRKMCFITATGSEVDGDCLTKQGPGSRLQ